MGSMMFVTLENPIRGLKDDMSGKALAYCHLQIDVLARKLGLQPLEDFISFEPEALAELMEDMKGPNGEAIELPEEQWFDAADGLRTIGGLLAHLQGNPEELAKIDRLDPDRGGCLAEGVVRDLLEAEKLLSAAAKRNVRFHLDCTF